MLAPAGGARRTPIVISPRDVEETVTLDLPAGFKIDEMPSAASLDTPFGRYSLTYSGDGARVTVRRRLEVPLKIVPLADHGALHAFFDKVRAADAAPIVLRR